ncbi:MAG: phosphoribosylformylglycinamidine synthase subunit PurQ [Candidatus Altiarchaeales archaeon ex4484_96]|nr:MAG: phosphoribosylformylglycinamidine synthase subunit PurQ [Candidatus Altiarchaeales archaeon ex4484_96]
MPDVCVLLIEGTNCEKETQEAFSGVGLDAELVHLKQLLGDCERQRKRRLSDYGMLMLPGGWSAGDYIRAGAIFAARMKSKLGDELKDFVESGNLVLGVCNGFQILTEMGLLPAFKGISDVPTASLTNNLSSCFQCRPTYIKHVNKTPLTGKLDLGDVIQVPVAHAEGRFTFGEKQDMMLKQLIENNQIVFRYCRVDGSEAQEIYPWNPNGSIYDIAGICNPERNVLGLMPHPERVINRLQMTDWTRKDNGDAGDGRVVFESIAGYLKAIV